MRQTYTLAGDCIAWRTGPCCTQKIAIASLAVLFGSITIESSSTSVAVEPLSVILAFQTLASRGITAARNTEVDVTIARTALAGSTRNLGITKVVIGTTVTVRTSIARVTVTDHMA